MKKNELSKKLPYSSPAIDVISFQDRLATICISDGQVEDMDNVYGW